MNSTQTHKQKAFNKPFETKWFHFNLFFLCFHTFFFIFAFNHLHHFLHLIHQNPFVRLTFFSSSSSRRFISMFRLIRTLNTENHPIITHTHTSNTLTFVPNCLFVDSLYFNAIVHFFDYTLQFVIVVNLNLLRGKAQSFHFFCFD